jgi:hypothetical protein
MQYNWPKVVELLRQFAQNRTKILGNGPEQTLDYMGHLRLQMQHTDTFHPWNSDGELSRAFDKMPKRCNYRSIKPYWAYKDGKERLADACYEVLCEMEELILEWFGDSWNHAPGYRAPKEIDFPSIIEDDAVKLARQIHSLCKKA